MGMKQSKIVEEPKVEENIQLKQREEEEDESGFSSPARERYIKKCVPLHSASLKGDWDSAAKLLHEDPTLLTAELTEGREIALHIAAVEGHATFVDNLLHMMQASDVQRLNKKGCTALAFAAAAGHVDIAQMMVHKNPKLPTIKGPDGVTPLFMAALIGCSDVADYLFSLPGFEFWTQEDQLKLLIASIDSGLYGLAMNILDRNAKLAAMEDLNGETPLAVLARKPSAFCGDGQQGLSQSIAGRVLTLMKLKRDDDQLSAVPPADAYALFDQLWDCMIRQQDIETGQYYDGNTSRLVFIAAESGNYHFLVELLRKDPVFVYKVNHSSHSIFHMAILNRHVEIFNLIYELNGMKDLMVTYVDPRGNNMLHLAAMLAPRPQLNDIPGAALQMQREVLWYKEVEKIVQPSYRDMRNTEERTPHELFLEQHGELMKEGEKEMKQTAKSFMLVTMLITTVVFAAAFTVPGGYDDRTGAPTMGKHKMFMIFPISEGVATMSSLASMLMFLSILTSRYTEADFLSYLPFWLVMGTMALFVSIVAMVAALCSSILLYEHGLATIIALMVLFLSVPLMFIAMKYQPLFGILRCTYGSRWLFGSNNRLLS